MKLPVSRQSLPFWATVLIGAILYAAASVHFADQRFFSLRVLINFLSDNAFLGVTAIGMTFVILSGGIDLSVGAVIGCVSIMIGNLVAYHHVHPAVVIPIVLTAGTLFGAGQGCLIRFFGLQPFLVTLGGLFFCRGAGLLIGTESIPIEHPFYTRLASVALPLGGGVELPLTAMIFLAVVVVAIFISLYRPFGRYVYAIGGNEQSATLMGLPVGSTKIGIYALSGFCSALAGVVATLYMSSGNATTATGLELDAIAAVVVGGTVLSGGVGYVAGTFIGVLIFGIIQTGITFQGTLNPAWTRIAIGILLLGFIVLQKLLQPKVAA